MSSIYALLNLNNGKIYVGQTLNYCGLATRNHFGSLRSGSHYNTHLQRAWNKHGSNWAIGEVQVCPAEDLDLLENFWISETGSWKRSNGYNLERFARGTGPRSEEVRSKISSSHKGKRLSEEHRKHLSEAMQGRVFTDEHRQRISRALKGKRHPEEVLKRIAASRKGKGLGPRSEETCKRISESKVGELNPSFGSRWMVAPLGNRELVRREEIQGRLEEGWVFGRPDISNRAKKSVWMYHPETGERKRVLRGSIYLFIQNGWKRGKKVKPRRKVNG